MTKHIKIIEALNGLEVLIVVQDTEANRDAHYHVDLNKWTSLEEFMSDLNEAIRQASEGAHK